MKKAIKRIISAILACVTAFSIVPAMAEDDITVTVDGKKLDFDVPPIIENDRTLVPFRAIFEALGAKVEWDGEEQRVLAFKQSGKMSTGAVQTTILLSIGSDSMTKQVTSFKSKENESGTNEVVSDVTEHKTISLDTPAKIVNDRTLVPLRAVSEAFDADVQWDGDARLVTITSAPEPTDAPTQAPETTQTPEKQSTLAEKLMAHMPHDRNYMLSPFSLRMALMMAANGAEGETRKEILGALNIDEANVGDFNDYALSFVEYMENAKQMNSEVADDAHKRPEFALANSIWLNEDTIPNAEFSKEFEDLIINKYGGTSERVNNKNAVERVNGWVNEKTNGTINNLIDSSDFLAAIVNAIYMKAQWETQFPEGATKKNTFTDRNGKKAELDFMEQTGHFYYYENENTEIVRLPYYGGLSAYFIIGDMIDIEHQSFDSGFKTVHVKIPKFRLDSDIDLKDILAELGIKRAFSKDTAQFSPMFENAEAYIDKVIQKTHIDMNENGTEASAATVVAMAPTSAQVQSTPEPVMEFVADEPFEFYICDDETGEIFFMGEYAYVE